MRKLPPFEKHKSHSCNQKQKSSCIHLAGCKSLSEMAAAHHKSLVSSVSFCHLARIKYRWLQIIEQLRFQKAANKTRKLNKWMAAKQWKEEKGVIKRQMGEEQEVA